MNEKLTTTAFILITTFVTIYIVIQKLDVSIYFYFLFSNDFLNNRSRDSKDIHCLKTSLF